MVFVTHPFAEQLCRIIFPDCEDMVKLWNTYLFVNFDCLFETSDISCALQEASSQTLGTSIGLQNYCQLAIFIRKTHCPILETMIGLQGQDSAASLQAGHLTVTENWIYGVLAGYPGDLPEHLVKPYANVSAE